ncbi:MAG: hypothetical protein QXY87_04070 [Saccharolobus sp.]|uniref:hypothetical protein n=1 Tax=Saccharolobus TaxID=2100760 RepID=UPI001F0D08D7|nr:hypothetical protein [Saccharolobus shibatae]MCH4814973.1 hypothetical protein [Saccharolobus shibatae]
MKVKTQVKAKVTNYNNYFKSLTIEDLLNILVDNKEAYLNDISIPKEIGKYVINSIKANTPVSLHLNYIEYEANLTLEVEDYGLSIRQGDKEILTIEFHGNKAILLTPKHEYKIRNADKLREMLRHRVSAYV